MKGHKIENLDSVDTLIAQNGCSMKILNVKFSTNKFCSEFHVNVTYLVIQPQKCEWCGNII